ncbi:uncharacterized protein LOC131876213 [Cryptomeria japonica]|uniref:uncharacterized protein LOC131876213 n=1 Tax=Cryptomeria japonica TaxID=3369 RepID=UPI0027DA5F8D|nr:uncharacterized protein LOC131876213 [Cryptomeria japonica]
MPGTKRKFPSTIQVGTKLTDILSGRFLPQKYNDPGSLVITLSIGGVEIPSVLIDLGAAMNVITTDTIEILRIPRIQPTTTMLQLANQSTAKREGVLKDVTVTIYAWDYPVDFLVLKARKKASRYPIILGRPCLETTLALIDCKFDSMTISNCKRQKELTLYPLAKPTFHSDTQYWVDEEIDSEGDGVVELAMVTLSEHVEEYEEYVEQGEDLNYRCGDFNQKNEECPHEEIKMESHKEVLHHDKLHPCPLDTLIGDPFEGRSDTKEITVSSDKPLFINSSLLPT